jgi:hypothetical protein
MDSTLAPAAAPTLHRALAGPWQAAGIYAVAGLVLALLTALALLISDHTAVLPQRLAVVTMVYAWPIVLTTNLLTDASRRIQARNVAIYAAILLVLVGFDFRSAAVLWFLQSGIATILLLAFMLPRVRTIGPLVFAFMTIGAFGANLLLVPLENSSVQGAAGKASASTGLDVTVWIILALLIGFAIASVVGWATLTWVRRRYDAKIISDQSLVIDAIWLFFTVVNAVDIATASSAWAFASLGTFVVYRLLVAGGFRLVRGSVGVAENRALLLLRVFGSATRSQRLMAQVGARWRYVGSINLIAGTDLATATLEPHEFLEYVRGRLGNRIIRDEDSLERHVAEMDAVQDFDMRFRINQFLCYDDTWRTTLARLAQLTDAVLVDLRAFSPANQGVVFELQALINLVPLSRVVLIVDGTTDVPWLSDVLEQAWTRISPTSPNVSAETAELVLCRLEDTHDSRAVRTLLAGLAEASVSHGAASTVTSGALATA